MVTVPKFLEDDKPIMVWQRTDRKSPEFDKNRPWLVMSTTYLHRLGIFFAPPFNSAKTRTQLALCVYADPSIKSAGVVDVQQLWTFPVERIMPAQRQKEVHMAPDTADRVREELKNYLAFAEGPRDGWLCQGRIVWLRLIPQWKDPSLAPGTDMDGLLKIAERLPHVALDRPDDWTIPALVIANDSYLPASFGETPNGIYAVVTVIPLILTSPELQTPKNLQIGQPNSEAPTLTPLTQCFLTLAYNESAADGYEGIKFEHKEQNTWCIEDDVRRSILDEIWSILALRAGFNA